MGELFCFCFYQRYLNFDKLNQYKETGMEKDKCDWQTGGGNLLLFNVRCTHRPQS